VIRPFALLLSLFLTAQAGAAELKDLVPRAAAPLNLPVLAGGTMDLKQLRGKVVLVNFWATWCPPCRKEMPSMNRLNQLMQDQPFAILGVNAGESAEAVHAFLMQTPVNFPILVDEEGVSLKPWQAFVFPTSYVVDKRGRVRMGLIGSIEWDAPETVARLEALLAEQ
jgi:thiol-disulfide isomerase/thioredoxin